MYVAAVSESYCYLLKVTSLILVRSAQSWKFYLVMLMIFCAPVNACHTPHGPNCTSEITFPMPQAKINYKSWPSQVEMSLIELYILKVALQ